MREIDKLNRIKKLIIIAIFSDDDLLDTLVLKGGNAVDLIHGVAMRGSIDLDFSMESDFSDPDISRLRERFENLLNTTFAPEGLHALDVRFRARPPVVTADMQDFWGGYELEFKIVSRETLADLADDERRLRHAAETVGPGGSKRFRVDFSRHEYCKQKEERTLDGYTVYVYTPEMIVCEKLRAICQQTDEYRRIVKSRRGARQGFLRHSHAG